MKYIQYIKSRVQAIHVDLCQLNTLYISFLYICRTVNVDTDQIFKITFLKIIQLKNIQLKIIQFMAILMNYTDHIKIIFAKTSCLIFAACCLFSQSMEPNINSV